MNWDKAHSIELFVQLEEKDALIAHRDKMHKFTQFYLNIPKIESLLDEHSYFSLFGGVRKEESIEEADVPFLSEVVKDLVSSNLDQKITTWTQGLSSTNPTNQTMRIARNAVTDVAAVMAPKVFTFYMTPPGADDCPVYDRESVKLMIQSLTNISSRNPEKPLKLTLEYSEPTSPQHNVDSGDYESPCSTYGVLL